MHPAKAFSVLTIASLALAAQSTTARAQRPCLSEAAAFFDRGATILREAESAIATAATQPGTLCEYSKGGVAKLEQLVAENKARFSALNNCVNGYGDLSLNNAVRSLEEFNQKARQDCAAVANEAPTRNTGPAPRLNSAISAPPRIANRTGASTPYPFDCSKKPIDANVAWHYTCNPARPTPELTRSAYRHPITPQTLYGKAFNDCRTTPVEQQRTCIADAKKNVLLSEDPVIRARCGTLVGSQQVHCVERFYLFGPDAGTTQNVRAYIQQTIDYQNRVESALRRLLEQTNQERDRFDPATPQWATLNERAHGYFNALNGSSAPPADAEALSQTNSPEALTPSQSVFDRVVRGAIDAAIEANKNKISEADQQDCIMAAYRDVWAIMRGNGKPQAPAKCSDIVSDAVAQLAYQAAAQFSSAATTEEDLLEHYLKLRSESSGGTNDGNLNRSFEAIGLTPDREMQQQGNELLRNDGRGR
jgi:hypothetical protein